MSILSNVKTFVTKWHSVIATIFNSLLFLENFIKLCTSNASPMNAFLAVLFGFFAVTGVFLNKNEFKSLIGKSQG